MKKMKKPLALLLTVLLAFCSLALTASASVPGGSYTAYQDMDYSFLSYYCNLVRADDPRDMQDDAFYLMMKEHAGEDEESGRIKSFELLVNNAYTILFYDADGNDLTPVAMTDKGDPYAFGVTHTYEVTFSQYQSTVYICFEVPTVSPDEISVTINDGIGVNFLLGLDDPSREGVESVTVTYKNLSGETVTETRQKNALPVENGKYKITVRIAPAQLADEITVKVGSEDAIGTSVLNYCEELISGDYAQKYKDVALALEQYAQAANNVFGYSDDTITDIGELSTDAVQNAAVVFNDATGAVTGASFMALTKPEFRFYTAGIDETTAVDYNEAGVTATMADGGDTLNARFVKKADGKVLLEVTGVSAENMDKDITVTVTGLGDITFNGNAFAKAMAKSGNTAQQNLGAALYNYGAAAKKCFTAEKIVDLGTLDGDYEAQDGDVLTGTLAGDYKITVADGANVTLKDANVTCLTKDAEFAAINPLGDAAITIEGTNTVKGGDEEYPGIYVPKNKTLTIDGAGSLKADSGGYSCGIGGGDQISAGNIVINGSTITADGGESAAGIGSGYLGECGSITINGGTVTANGGGDAAGIGSGSDADCGDITINGGTVTANGGWVAAGIGSGSNADCGDITISGGTVTAYGGFESAGIGSGVEADCGDITISGGTVTAEGGYRAVGIGSGEDGSCDNITISGGTVTAKATERSGYPAIGSSAYASCGNILIKNTVAAVYLLPSGGQDQVAAIGAAGEGTCGTVTIEDGANVIRN